MIRTRAAYYGQYTPNRKRRRWNPRGGAARMAATLTARGVKFSARSEQSEARKRIPMAARMARPRLAGAEINPRGVRGDMTAAELIDAAFLAYNGRKLR